MNIDCTKVHNCANKIEHIRITNTTKIIKKIITIPVSKNLKKSYSCTFIIAIDNRKKVYITIATPIPSTSPEADNGKKFVNNVLIKVNTIIGKSEYVVETYTSLKVPLPENIEQTNQLHTDHRINNPTVATRVYSAL